MKNNLTTLFGLMILFALQACARNSDSVDAMPLSITSAITRVDGLNFESGDQIGLTVTRTSGTYADNVLLTNDGAVFSAPELIWYDGGDASSLTAYYPYRSTGMPVQFEVAADQSAGCESSDLLVAVKSNVVPSSSAVPMVFRHMMARVVATITNNTGSSVTELRIAGTIPSADVQCAMQSVTVRSSSAPVDIVAFPKSPGRVYEAIVVPQSVAIAIRVKTADGKSRSTTFESNTLQQGRTYAVGLVVEKDKLIATLSGEIADWESGGELTPGDGGGSGGSTDPGGTMVCEGKTYRTETFGNLEWMAENLKHVPSARESSGGIWYPNGSVDVAVVAEFGMLYDINAARRLCPEGWRIPTEADFTTLIAELGSSYADFIPMAGVYICNSGAYTKHKQFGYLMGQTPSELANKYKCFCIPKGQVPQIVPDYPGENGLSLRFVRNI